MLYRNVSTKTVVIYNKRNQNPRMVDPGQTIDSDDYPSVVRNTAFIPLGGQKKLQPPTEAPLLIRERDVTEKERIREEQAKDLKNMAISYENLVMHMSKIKGEVTKLQEELASLREEVDVIKGGASIKAEKTEIAAAEGGVEGTVATEVEAKEASGPTLELEVVPDIEPVKKEVVNEEEPKMTVKRGRGRPPKNPKK